MKLRGFLPLFAAFLLVSLRAGAAVVTTCDDAGLRAAMAAGGSVTFGCDGTIVLTNTIEITNDVAVDAAGRAVAVVVFRPAIYRKPPSGYSSFSNRTA